MKKLVFVSLILIFSLAMLAPALAGVPEPEQLYWQRVRYNGGTYEVYGDIEDELEINLDNFRCVQFLTEDEEVIPATDVNASTTVVPNEIDIQQIANQPYFDITTNEVGECRLSIVSGGTTYAMDVRVKQRQLFYYEIEANGSGYQLSDDNENELSLVAGESIDLQFAKGRNKLTDLLDVAVTDISISGDDGLIEIEQLETGQPYLTVTAGDSSGEGAISITVAKNTPNEKTYVLEVEVVPPRLYGQQIWYSNDELRFNEQTLNSIRLAPKAEIDLRFLTDNDDGYQGADGDPVLDVAVTDISIETDPAGCLSVELAEDYEGEDGGPFFTVSGKAVGEGTLSVTVGVGTTNEKTYMMDVAVALPNEEFFSKPEYTEEAYLGSHLEFGPKGMVFYYLCEDGFAVDDPTKPPTLDWGNDPDNGLVTVEYVNFGDPGRKAVKISVLPGAWQEGDHRLELAFEKDGEDHDDRFFLYYDPLFLYEWGFFRQPDYDEDNVLRQAYCDASGEVDFWFMHEDGFSGTAGISLQRDGEAVTDGSVTAAADDQGGKRAFHISVDDDSAAPFELSVTVTDGSDQYIDSIQVRPYLAAEPNFSICRPVDFSYGGKHYQIGFIGRNEATYEENTPLANGSNNRIDGCGSTDHQWEESLYLTMVEVGEEQGLTSYTEATALYDLIGSVTFSLATLDANNVNAELQLVPEQNGRHWIGDQWQIISEGVQNGTGQTPRHYATLRNMDIAGNTYVCADVTFKQAVMIDNKAVSSCRTAFFYKNILTVTTELDLSTGAYAAWGVDQINDYLASLPVLSGVNHTYRLLLDGKDYNGTIILPAYGNTVELQGQDDTVLRGSIYAAVAAGQQPPLHMISRISFVSPANTKNMPTYGDNKPNQGVYGPGNIYLSYCSFSGYYYGVNVYGKSEGWTADNVYQSIANNNNIFQNNHVGLYLNGSGLYHHGVNSPKIQKSRFHNNDVGVLIEGHIQAHRVESLIHFDRCEFTNNGKAIVNRSGYRLRADRCYFGNIPAPKQRAMVTTAVLDPNPAANVEGNLVLFPTYDRPCVSVDSPAMLIIPAATAADPQLLLPDDDDSLLLDEDFQGRLQISDDEHFEFNENAASGEYQPLATWDFSATAGGEE